MRHPTRHPWSTTLVLAAVVAVVLAVTGAATALGDEGGTVDLGALADDITTLADPTDRSAEAQEEPAADPVHEDRSSVDEPIAPDEPRHPAGAVADLSERRAEAPDEPEVPDEPETLRPGDSGPEVEALQRDLDALGYWPGPVDGAYDELTRQAVLAFQGEEGLVRDGLAGPQVRGALETADRPQPHTGAGDRIEVDLDRQVLRVVRGGTVETALHVSSGHGGTYEHPDGGTRVAATPTGSYRVERRIDGWRYAPLGDLYRPAYFNGGIAIHGYTEVPAEPASSGCVRVTLEAMDLLWSLGHVTEGTPVVVH